MSQPTLSRSLRYGEAYATNPKLEHKASARSRRLKTEEIRSDFTGFSCLYVEQAPGANPKPTQGVYELKSIEFLAFWWLNKLNAAFFRWTTSIMRNGCCISNSSNTNSSCLNCTKSSFTA